MEARQRVRQRSAGLGIISGLWPLSLEREKKEIPPPSLPTGKAGGGGDGVGVERTASSA